MGRSKTPTEDFGKIWRTTLHGKKAAGVWYRDSSGQMRRMRRTGATWPQAEEILKKAVKAKLSEAGADLTSDWTVTQLLEVWWEEYKRTEPAHGTLRTYESHKRALERGLGDIALHECTVPRVDRYFKSLTIRAVNARRAILRGAFSLAVRHGAMRANPMPDIAKPPAVPRSKRKPVQAPDAKVVAEVRKLMRAWDHGHDGRAKHGKVMPRNTGLEDFVIMLAATGARPSEVLALTWPDIDLESGQPTATINATLTYEHGTNKIIRQEYPKTTRSERVLKLPPFAVDMLLRRRVEAPNEKVFPNRRGGWLGENNLMTNRWRRAVEGTPYAKITPMSYRRAVGTLLGQNVDAETASRQLGNTEAVALKHYIAPMNMGPDAVALLEDAFGSPEAA